MEEWSTWNAIIYELTTNVYVIIDNEEEMDQIVDLFIRYYINEILHIWPWVVIKKTSLYTIYYIYVISDIFYEWINLDLVPLAIGGEKKNWKTYIYIFEKKWEINSIK